MAAAPEQIAGSNPTSWVETKGGVTSDVRDALLRQKEQGEVQASAMMAPAVLAALDKPGSMHQPATNVGTDQRAYERLKREAVRQDRLERLDKKARAGATQCGEQGAQGGAAQRAARPLPRRRPCCCCRRCCAQPSTL